MIFKAPRHAIDRFLLAAFVLLWPPFALLVTRRSGGPEVFGLWSMRYFVVLLGYAAGLLLAGCVAYAILRAGAGRLRLFAVLASLHRIRPLYWLAVVLPPLLWVMVVAAIIRIGVLPTPAILLCLFDFALVVICCECVLALIGQAKKRQRELVLKFILAGVATTVTLVLVEIVAAVTGIGTYATWEINPRQLDVRFQTDDFDIQVVTNRQGLREPEMISAAHPGLRRAVIIGDSMTFGWGVEYEQAYAQVAQRTLRDVYGRTDLEVINMGRPGAGPHDYLKYLRQYASQLRPDMIVIGFLVGNDCPVIPPARLENAADVERALAEHTGQAHASWLERLTMKSFIARLCYVGLANPSSTDGAAAAGTATGKRGPVFNEPNPLDPTAIGQAIAAAKDPAAAAARYDTLTRDGWVDRGLQWRMNPWLVRAIILHPAGAADSLATRPESFETMQFEWQLCEGLLREIKATADAINVPLVILAIPNAHLVSQRWVDFLEQRGCETNPQMTTSRVVNDWLGTFCEKEKILCVDPLSTFRERQAAGEELYLQTDDHMTPAGYALLGEALAEALHDQLPAAGGSP